MRKTPNAVEGKLTERKAGRPRKLIRLLVLFRLASWLSSGLRSLRSYVPSVVRTWPLTASLIGMEGWPL